MRWPTAHAIHPDCSPKSSRALSTHSRRYTCSRPDQRMVRDSATCIGAARPLPALRLYRVMAAQGRCFPDGDNRARVGTKPGWRPRRRSRYAVRYKGRSFAPQGRYKPARLWLAVFSARWRRELPGGGHPHIDAGTGVRYGVCGRAKQRACLHCRMSGIVSRHRDTSRTSPRSVANTPTVLIPSQIRCGGLGTRGHGLRHCDVHIVRPLLPVPQLISVVSAAA